MWREGNYEGKRPLLYLVATPIGNLSEFSSRAILTLKEMDYIACEDTRNSGLLFSKFEIKKPLISCHEHNEEEASDKIIALLKEGKKVAYCSDAGYPTVSDPGSRLVKRCVKEEIKVAVINGPSASLCALAGSGIDTSHYYFEGFLPAKEKERDKELEELKAKKETIIFYESPHRIGKTLKALETHLGKERNACLCRELTKLHEEYIHATLEELAAIDEDTLLGEMVIVVEGAKESVNELSEEEIIALLKELTKEMKGKEAVKEISSRYGVSKNKVYDIYLKMKDEN